MSLTYNVISSNILQSIEVSNGLNKIKFHLTQTAMDMAEEDFRIAQGTIAAAVYPKFPEIGRIQITDTAIEINAMKDLGKMSPSNRARIDEELNITEELHTIEFILTKAKNSELIPADLYKQIRIELRNKIKQARYEFHKKTQFFEDESVKFQSRAKELEQPNFKQISSHSDVDEFEGKIVAFKANTYYYSSDRRITSPADNTIQFALISQNKRQWKNGDFGYKMELFNSCNSSGATRALIDDQLNHDNVSMRLASAYELEYLLLACELDQGYFECYSKEHSKNQINSELQRIPDSLPSLRSNVQTFLENLEQLTELSYTDWDESLENKDKAEFISPSKAYLIKGGSEIQRTNYCSSLILEDALNLPASYKENKELAVAFLDDHRSLLLLNFKRVKEIAGTTLLGGSHFRTSTFGNEPRFGVIDLDTEDTENRSTFSTCSIL